MLSKRGLLSTFFSIIELVFVAFFYFFQLNTVWVFLVGVILFVLGIIFSVQSFMKREKGF